jgi:hypothetical protein
VDGIWCARFGTIKSIASPMSQASNLPHSTGEYSLFGDGKVVTGKFGKAAL